MNGTRHGHRAFHQHEQDNSGVTPGIAIILLMVYVPGMAVFTLGFGVAFVLSLMTFNPVGGLLFGAITYWAGRITLRGFRSLSIGLSCMARSQYIATKEGF